MHLNYVPLLDLLGFGIYYKPDLPKHPWIFLNCNWVGKWNSQYIVENQEFHSLVNLCILKNFSGYSISDHSIYPP